MRALAAVLAALTAAAAATSSPLALSEAGREGFLRYRDNLVAITYTLRPREKPTGGEGMKVEEAVCGVVVGPDGLIVTSADPFPDPGGDPKSTLEPVEFKVHLRGRRPMDAVAVGLDRDLNLAFLRLRGAAPEIRNLRFDDTALQVGDPLLVLGVLSKEYDYEPIFYSATVNAVLDRPRRMYSLDIPLQDLAIGGLVLTPGGRPIGIVGEDVLKDAPGRDRMPANILSIFGSFTQGRRVGYPMVFPYAVFAAQLASPPPIEVEERRSWLGIIMQALGEDLIDYWKLDVEGGVIISSVVEGSPAEQAGLQPADILIGLQGDPLRVTKDEDLAEFRRRIERMGVGEEVRLTLLRRGERQEIALPLGEAPHTAWTVEELEDEDLGLTVREIIMDDLLASNLDPATEGVVISELDRAGWAQIAGLQEGDIVQSVDGRPITDLATFRAQMDRLREDKPESTLFFVLRQTDTVFVRVRTPWTNSRRRS